MKIRLKKGSIEATRDQGQQQRGEGFPLICFYPLFLFIKFGVVIELADSVDWSDTME
jgi:hypothetical protein